MKTTKHLDRLSYELSRDPRKPVSGVGTEGRLAGSLEKMLLGIPTCTVPVKRHRGEPGHTRDTHGTRGRTRAHGTHRQTSQPSKPNDTPARTRDGRNRGRLKRSTSAGQFTEFSSVQFSSVQFIWGVSRESKARGPADHELFGRGVYVPLFLFPNLPSLSILFDLYLYTEGTQASTLTLWRVSSWSPSRSCSFRCLVRCVSSSPSTLTPTASLESTFDRLPLGCLLFM